MTPTRRKWVDANRERIRAYRRKYHAEAYANNPEYKAARLRNNRKYYRTHKAKADAATKKWRAEHAEYVKAYKRLHWIANGKAMRQNSKRRKGKT